MYFELVPYLRGLWTRTLAKVFCHFGHHDYESHGLGNDFAVLECFYCQHQKRSFVVNVGGTSHGMSKERSIMLLNNMRAIQDNWDGENAPAPSQVSIDRAIAICQCVVPGQVDIDVMGGIALYYYGDKQLWIHVKNDGTSVLTVM